MGNDTDMVGKEDSSKSPTRTQPESAMPQPNARIPLKNIDQLIIHNSDTTVKPIIGNKEIEKIPELVYNSSQLPFTAQSAEQVAGNIDSPAIEGHLQEIY